MVFDCVTIPKWLHKLGLSIHICYWLLVWLGYLQHDLQTQHSPHFLGGRYWHLLHLSLLSQKCMWFNIYKMQCNFYSKLHQEFQWSITFSESEIKWLKLSFLCASLECVLENIKQNIIGMFYLLKYQTFIESTPELGRVLERYYLPSVCHNIVEKRN